MNVIARVLPLTRTRAVRGEFDYRLGPEHEGVQAGTLLRVPFGHQTTLAVVTQLVVDSDVPTERLVEPEAVLDLVLPPDLVELARWMAREYCSTSARALSVLLPPGAGNGLSPGTRLMAELTDAGRAALDDAARLTDAQRGRLEHLAARGETAASTLGTPALRRLESRGLVSIRATPSHRGVRRHRVSDAARAAPPLTTEQRAALAPIEAAVRSAGSAETFLLHGVTGSGKTEVYLRAAQVALDAGRAVIILVPEIALTPQALARFEARFGEIVAVIHSGLGQRARAEEWRRMAAGEARVCVGPRSAVFAPLADIGLIVVDEEHESSYKHEGDPRYDARAVAQQRARVHGAVLVAGSATPRPESAEHLRRLRLGARVDGRPLPSVEIVDMRGCHHPLHPRTRMALADLKRASGKAIVLLNRRGWSNFLSCRSCGEVRMCPNCEVALVLHRAEGTVACHHCGHRAPIPERCQACGSISLARHGAGTERIERDLVRALGDEHFPILRLDTDVTGIDARAETLERFYAAPAGILIGTQMVAKGHDFTDVTLGVVIDADQTLRFPDFRAEERTFALVTQLAGRAGRAGGAPGRVLVQTLAPEARAIQLAAEHDADGFLHGELARRRALRYPPFATLIRVVCSAIEPRDAAELATSLRELIDPPAATVLGPSPLFTLRGRARMQLVVKAADRHAAIDAVGAAVAELSARASRRHVNLSVDVDPQ